jgi:hypothetical protein
MEGSAKTGENVNEAFEKLAEFCLNSRLPLATEQLPSNGRRCC